MAHDPTEPDEIESHDDTESGTVDVEAPEHDAAEQRTPSRRSGTSR